MHTRIGINDVMDIEMLAQRMLVPVPVPQPA